jgi:hypothetical protein
MHSLPFFSARSVLVDTNDRGINDHDLVVDVGSKRVDNALPNAGLRPPQEARVHGLPFRVLRRQVTPRRSCSQYPKHRVDHDPVRQRLSTSSAVVERQQFLDSLPLLFGQLVAMRCHRGV